MEEYIFFNNKTLPKGKAKILIQSPGFLFGDGVFETIKSYSGYICRIDLHLERLLNSLRTLKYVPEQPESFKSLIRESIRNLLKINNLSDREANIKIIVSRGTYGKKLDIASAGNSDLTISASPIGNKDMEYYGKGVNVISSAIKRTSDENFIYKHKLINYFENVYAKNEAASLNAQEAVFLTYNDFILEGATSNIFFVFNDIVVTPPLTQNILPGITRRAVIDLCKENNIKIIERMIRYEEIADSDEIFLTNSIFEILPVKKIDNFKIKGAPGNITKKLMFFYKETLV
ncbi:aminotransferase class IV [bacterium]|nr:aminotransferase class IV [bacterium]